MTSRFNNTETMTRRLGRTNQKTTNISTSKRYGGTRANPDEIHAQNAKNIFQNRLPNKLKIEKEIQPEAALKVKAEEVKDSSQPEASSTMKKEETSYDLGTSEMEQSDDEHKKLEAQRKAKQEKMLEQNIYITLNETPTNILFYCPSTKYLTLKNEEEMAREKAKGENYNEYLLKLKNKESFVRKGVQTVNRFKSNALVSTSFNKDSEFEMVDEKVNCLNYVISDSIADKKTKISDENLLVQKMVDKRVKRELKQTLKHSKELQPVDTSIRSVSKSDADQSASMMDTYLSSSLHSSRRPKAKANKSNMGTSQDRSNTNDPNSSYIKNSTNSEQQNSSKVNNYSGPVVNSQHVRRAFNEELPNTIVGPLKYVERLLSQNQFHFRQIAYKDYPISLEEFEVKKQKKATDLASMGLVGDGGKDDDDQATKNMQKEIALITDNSNEPNLKKLFTYSIDGLLKEHGINSHYIVHAMDWNSQNPDLLAAVYGDPDINSKEPGFLCFWTLKNPLRPERVIQTPRGLTFCNFSKKNPYLIVCSDYNGEIMIFDLRTNSDKPMADSSEVKDKHTDIVWECKWIERPNDKNEIIITSSSDGKIKEWSLKKGLEVTDLLKMKKSTTFPMKQLNPFAKYLKKDRGDKNDSSGNKDIKETLIFREANGLSFDFPNNDTTIYYVALEECTIHRCRISYKDQYTDNYYGHQGPVYKIRCNPFDPNILISCSYDWCVKIWNNKHNYPVMNLHTNELCHQVNDIEWSKDTSTVFGDVADDGRIEIWDLARSAIQPIIVLIDEDKVPKKSIKFSEGAKVVATGSASGNIDIYRIYNMEHSPVSDEHQVKRLQNIIEQNSDISTKM